MGTGLADKLFCRVAVELLLLFLSAAWTIVLVFYSKVVALGFVQCCEVCVPCPVLRDLRVSLC